MVSSCLVPVSAFPSSPSTAIDGTSDRPVTASRRDLPALYDAHFDLVWRCLRRFGVPHERLEDAVQEVFLVVHRRWDSFTHKSSEQTWLYGIALHVAQNERRALRRRQARTAPATEEAFWERVPSPTAGPAELLAKLEGVRLIEQALESLSDKERSVFVLVELEATSVAEAAQALGINPNTAQGRLRAARAEFQRAVQRLRAGTTRPEKRGQDA